MQTFWALTGDERFGENNNPRYKKRENPDHWFYKSTLTNRSFWDYDEWHRQPKDAWPLLKNYNKNLNASEDPSQSQASMQSTSICERWVTLCVVCCTLQATKHNTIYRFSCSFMSNDSSIWLLQPGKPPSHWLLPKKGPHSSLPPPPRPLTLGGVFNSKNAL